VRYYTLHSSSKRGNSTLFVEGDFLFLIDAGGSFSKIKEKLAVLGYSPEDIQAVLLTHEHADHINGISGFKNKPIYMHKKIVEKLSFYHKLNDIQILAPNKTLQLGPFSILVLKNSHDSLASSLGFVITVNSERIVYITDTGVVPSKNLEFMRDAQYYIFESNHDIKSLIHNPDYSSELKTRILSDFGHLSNISASDTLKDLVGANTKEITLIHLSEDNNTPEIALKCLHENITNKNIFMQVAKSDEITFGNVHEKN
jgi:phosphoribosyl 1,2-cyclic phosphodiesterase